MTYVGLFIGVACMVAAAYIIAYLLGKFIVDWAKPRQCIHEWYYYDKVRWHDREREQYRTCQRCDLTERVS